MKPKAIMISIKPKWCADIMNGEKTIEVRKNKALAKAIQKLIYKYGYADVYVYCSKGKYEMGKFNSDKKYHEIRDDCSYAGGWLRGLPDEIVNGKVVFKFRCYKVEEIVDYGSYYLVNKDYPHTNKVARQSCLDFVDLKNYLKGENGYAIHINDLKIFDKPKELREFYTTRLDKDITKLFENSIQLKNRTWVKPITKAPQNFCYVEVE